MSGNIEELESVGEVAAVPASSGEGRESESSFVSLREVGPATEAALLALPPRQAAAALAAFDVAVVVFDAADATGASLDAAVATLIAVADAAGPELPFVLVAANDGGAGSSSGGGGGEAEEGGDGGASEEKEPASLSDAIAAACGSLSLRLPLPFAPSKIPTDAAAAYWTIASIARTGGGGVGGGGSGSSSAGGATPLTPLLRARRARERALRRALLGAAGGTAAALAGYFVYKAVSGSGSSSSTKTEGSSSKS